MGSKYIIVPYDRYMSMTRCTDIPNATAVKPNEVIKMVMDPAVKSEVSSKKRKMVPDSAVRNVDVLRRVKTRKKRDTPITRRELSSDPLSRTTDYIPRKITQPGKKRIRPPPAPPGVNVSWITY